MDQSDVPRTIHDDTDWLRYASHRRDEQDDGWQAVVKVVNRHGGENEPIV